MYYAMYFQKTEFNTYTVRAVKNKSFTCIEKAKKAVCKKGKGYIKMLSNPVPIWRN